MFNRLTDYLLTALVTAVCIVALVAPDAYGQDAGTDTQAAVEDTLSPAMVPGAVAPVDAGSEELLAWAGDLYAAVTSGDVDGWLVAALSLMILIGGARKFMDSKLSGSLGDKLEEYLYGTDIRGTVSTLMLSMLGAMATSIVAGGEMSFDLVKLSWGVGILAAGGYTMVYKRLILPLLSYAKNRVID